MPLEWVEENKKANAAAAAYPAAGKQLSQTFGKIISPVIKGTFPPLTITSTPVTQSPKTFSPKAFYGKGKPGMTKKKDEALIALDYFETHEALHGAKQSSLMRICDALPSTISLGENGPWIAGGAVRRWYTGIPQEGDADFFFANDEQYKMFCKELEQITEVPSTTNKFNTTFRLRVDDFWSVDIQAIQYKYFPNVYQLLNGFDLTVSQMAFDGQYIHTFQRTIDDNEKRQIKFHKITCGILSMMRIGKHMKQGYHIDMSDAQAFLEFIRDHPDRIQGPLISGTYNEHNK